MMSDEWRREGEAVPVLAPPAVLPYGRPGSQTYDGGETLARVAAWSTPAAAYSGCVLGCIGSTARVPAVVAGAVAVALLAMPFVGTVCGVIAYRSTMPRRPRRLIAVLVNAIASAAILGMPVLMAFIS